MLTFAPDQESFEFLCQDNVKTTEINGLGNLAAAGVAVWAFQVGSGGALVVVLVLVFALAMSGVAAYVVGGAKQTEKTVVPDPPAAVPDNLRQQAVKDARDAYEGAQKSFQFGITNAADLIRAHEKLVDAQIGASATKQDRINAYISALEEARSLEREAQTRVEIGVLAPADMPRFRSHRSEIEIALTKEGVTPPPPKPAPTPHQIVIPAPPQPAAPVDEAALLQHLMDDLCGRGVLKTRYQWERIGPTHASVSDIKKELEALLGQLPLRSDAREPIQKMQSATRDVLQNPDIFPPEISDNDVARSVDSLKAPIAAFRKVFETQRQKIVTEYALKGNCQFVVEPE